LTSKAIKICEKTQNKGYYAAKGMGGFNQRQGEALPLQIFLTLKFVVCIAFKIIEIVAT